jgi:glycyl-tRNA synthetase
MFEVPSTSNDFGIDFLRPELAQGIFVSYPSCQRFLQKEPPFGIAQTGPSYRKEISPHPYTRMREFHQAEIEYFFDPKDKTHHNYYKYKDISIPILTSDMQLKHISTPQTVTLEYALNNNMISSSLMAYFIAKIYLFALRIGLKKSCLDLDNIYQMKCHIMLMNVGT